MFYPVGFVKIKDPWTVNMMHNKHIGRNWTVMFTS